MLAEKYLARERDLSIRLSTMRDDALKRASEIFGRELSVHQFHAHIGRNNNTFVDSVRMQFRSPNNFLTQWLSGLTETVEAEKENIQKRRDSGSPKQTVELLPEMLREEFLRDYIYLFLERNFYRNYNARVRDKPDEVLWQLWFGAGSLVWGLLISPARRLGEWTNDKSEMRRENYSYWTIGHVLSTGLIAPDSDEAVTFQSVDRFLQFYEVVLARVSVSEYEKAISTKYINYVRSHSAPEEVPLLIPELRYAGKDRKHKYRLDFVVLNPHSLRMIGFEISPSSSHMKVSGKDKKLVQHNKELAASWDKESDKRNVYFNDYGIAVITFSDTHLEDIELCFSEIRKALEERSGETDVSVDSATERLQAVFSGV